VLNKSCTVDICRRVLEKSDRPYSEDSVEILATAVLMFDSVNDMADLEEIGVVACAIVAAMSLKRDIAIAIYDAVDQHLEEHETSLSVEELRRMMGNN